MKVVRIETDAPDTQGLATHLERYGCRVVARDGARLDVQFPEAESERDARNEAELYFSFWSGRERSHPVVVLAA